MKKFWNIFLLSTVIIATALTVWMYNISNNILPIKYEASVDHKELNICNKNILSHYHSLTDYVESKKAIKKELLPLINEKNIQFDSKNGYVTIRFIVNCNGEIGLFRANEIDAEMKAANYSSATINELTNIVSTLNNWEIKPHNGNKYDSYYFINFKIEEGQITDIF